MMKIFFLRSLLRDIDALLSEGRLSNARAVRLAKLKHALESILNENTVGGDSSMVQVPHSVRRKIERTSWMLSVSEAHEKQEGQTNEFAW